MLRLENSRYDFYFHRVELKPTLEITTVIGIDDTPLEGHVQRTDEFGRTQTFVFKATVQPHDGDDITWAWDFGDANAIDRETFSFHFEAEGTLRSL